MFVRREIPLEKYCDVQLLPSENRIDIVLRNSGDLIDTILGVSFQDGFLGWSSDIFVVDKWVWGFIDYDLAVKTFKEMAKDLLSVLDSKKVERYSTDWVLKIQLKRILYGTASHSKTTKRKLSRATKDAHATGVLGTTPVKVSSFTRRKMSVAHKGSKRSESHKESIRRARTGWKLSEETKRKIAERPNPARGEDCGNAVLTAEKVLSIVGLSKDGLTHRAIADHFRVSKGAATGVLSGRTWSHVTGIKFTKSK